MLKKTIPWTEEMREAVKHAKRRMGRYEDVAAFCGLGKVQLSKIMNKHSGFIYDKTFEKLQRLEEFERFADFKQVNENIRKFTLSQEEEILIENLRKLEHDKKIATYTEIFKILFGGK